MARNSNPSRQKQDRDPLVNTRKKRKQRSDKDRPVFSGPAHRKEHKVNPIKSRIRDLNRLLAKVDDMPADVRLAHERELAHLQRDLEFQQEEVWKANQKKDMFATYQKYKMVRFFDRQKAERRLKKIAKLYESAEDPAEKERLSQEKRIAEIDLNYTIYYPLAKPYSSLYPSKKSEGGKKNKKKQQQQQQEEGGDDEESKLKGNVEIWQQVEKATEEGQHALHRVRKALPGRDPVERTNTRKAERTKNQPVKHQPEPMDEDQNGEEDEDAEDGAGFFEAA